jgi:hypothetical protein
LRISLPQQAQDHFDQEADKFLLLLRPEPKKEERQEAPLSSSHQPVHVISEQEVLNVGTFGTLNGFGNQKSKYFHTDNGFIGLSEPDYVAFENLAVKIAYQPQIRQFLTLKYVVETIFKWFEERYKGSVPQSQSVTEYLSLKAESDIKEHRIGIPLSFIAIQEPFSVGKVTFDFYTKEFFDRLENAMREKNPNIDQEGLNKFRKKYQGVVFSNITVCAEQERCIETAVEETEKALMILRFFSPTTFWPEIPSYFGRMGHVNVPTGHYFIFENESPTIVERVEEKDDFRHKIDSEDLEMLRAGGLDTLSQLVTQQNHTDLEKLLLNSISLFTRSIVSRDHQDKIVFCLASLETLLLKNSTEPIQHSIGLRLAFITSDSLEARKKTIALVRDAYEIRSSYLHHGKRKEDFLMLTELQHTILSALTNVMLNRSKFSNQAQLLEYIENMILT